MFWVLGILSDMLSLKTDVNVPTGLQKEISQIFLLAF
jgi:hypothetical protein